MWLKKKNSFIEQLYLVQPLGRVKKNKSVLHPDLFFIDIFLKIKM